jgi:hypothetical protein
MTKLKTVTVECKCGCGVRFTAPDRIPRLSADCKKRIYEERKAAMRARGAGSRPQHKPRQVAIEFRQDFLLALPEMRREFKRACTGDLPLLNVEGTDMLALPDFPGRRRRSA